MDTIMNHLLSALDNGLGISYTRQLAIFDQYHSPYTHDYTIEPYRTINRVPLYRVSILQLPGYGEGSYILSRQALITELEDAMVGTKVTTIAIDD